MSESVTEVIQAIAARLAKKFTFGIYDRDEIYQEACLIALERLEFYDPSKGPLSNYLQVAVKNRLCNFKRDKFRRPEAPCEVCHRAYQEGGPWCGDGPCAVYASWRSRNDAKAALARPLGLLDKDDRPIAGEGPLEGMVLEEVLGRIDEELDVDLRADYLRMRAGERIPAARREAVVEAVREIIDGIS